MTVTYRVGADIANSDAQIICNTVNCVGVMGKGVALAIKERFPEVFDRYQKVCKEQKLSPGAIMTSGTKDGRTIINLATKSNWRDPSRTEWVGASLFFMNHLLAIRNVKPCKIAIPYPGAGNGGVDARISRGMIFNYLSGALSRGFELEIYGDPDIGMPTTRPDFYAGIGWRDTPKQALVVMHEFGGLAADKGIRLRSGGAVGADSAFEDGAQGRIRGNEIFVADKRKVVGDRIFDTRDVHYRIMRAIHPAPHKLGAAGTELMARNGCQLFGVDFTNPSKVVVCYTENGQMKGGTAQALRLALSAGIPILNLGDPSLKGITATSLLELAESKIEQRKLAAAIRIADPIREQAEMGI